MAKRPPRGALAEIGVLLDDAEHHVRVDGEHRVGLRVGEIRTVLAGVGRLERA